ncbi:transcriptional regulator, TetR family [Lachnospiraceae bacterium KM106-2]|nr:transcriptional regulator, TetR family [Lachnospiraceae bacterium KM106-2]
MAVADRTIDPRILASARKEFLECGFEKASLKNICRNAGVTTGAFYKRYSGKNDIFCGVVKQTVDDLNKIVKEKSERDLTKLSDQELIDAWDMDEEYMLWWFDYLYERYDDFVLLLKYSAGSSYYDFANEWVEVMNQATYQYYEEAYRRQIARKKVGKEEMHILISAFWTTIYEPFIHGMSKEQIDEHCKLVCHLINWHTCLEFQK